MKTGVSVCLTNSLIGWQTWYQLDDNIKDSYRFIQNKADTADHHWHTYRRLYLWHEPDYLQRSWFKLNNETTEDIEYNNQSHKHTRDNLLFLF